MSDGVKGTEDGLAYTVATWVYLLHTAGVETSDAEVNEECRGISTASDEARGDAAGEALVGRIRAILASEEPEAVAQAARELFEGQVRTDLGEGRREERTTRIRQYQFSRQLPWLARVWERTRAGKVRPLWLLIERVTDEVSAVDPNPWDEVEEEQRMPVGDFHVLWELAGCPSVAVL